MKVDSQTQAEYPIGQTCSCGEPKQSYISTCNPIMKRLVEVLQFAELVTEKKKGIIHK